MATASVIMNVAVGTGGSAPPAAPALLSPRASAARQALLRDLCAALGHGNAEQFEAAAADALTKGTAAAGGGGGSGAAVELVPTSMRDDSYRHPLAGLVCLLDAFFLGVVAWAMGFRPLGDNLVVPGSAGGAGAAPVFFSLERRAASDAHFQSRLRSAAAARRRLSALAVLLVVGIAWAQIEFWTGGYIISMPVLEVLGLTFAYIGEHSIAKNAALGFFAILTNIVLAVLYISFLLALQDKTALLDLPPKTLTAVFPFLLKANYPICMISYQWEGRGGTPFTARSLAYICPDSWLDIRFLSPGMNVPNETFSVSRNSYCLVAVVSPNYFQRPACLLELAAALLERDASRQHTVFFEATPGALPAAAAELLARNGARVFSQPDELLSYLSGHVYSCVDVDDSLRLVRWYRSEGVAEPHARLDRNLLLPSPAVKSPGGTSSNGAPVLASFLDPPAPRDAIVAGTTFISADGLQLGRCSAWSIEHLLIALLLEGLLLCLTTNYSVGALIFVAIVAVAAMLMSFVFPLSVYLDPRNRHSAELLPINAGAICNSVGLSSRRRAPSGARSPSGLGGEPSAPTPRAPSFDKATTLTSGVGRSGSGGGSSPTDAVEGGALPPRSSLSAATFSVSFYLSAEPSADLGSRLRNVAAFLGPFCCGLETSVEVDARFDDTGFTERLLAVSSAHIAVVVLQTKKDADAWLAGPAHSWPESQTVLCAPWELLDRNSASFCEPLQQFFCLLLPAAAAPAPAADALGAVRRLASAVLAAAAGRRAAAAANDLSPYRGFAASLLDAIGSKVGHSFFAASRAEAVRSAARNSAAVVKGI